MKCVIKYFVTPLVFLIYQTLIFGQNLDWVGQVKGSLNERGFYVNIDPLGNIFVVGHFEDNADLDPGPGVFWGTSTPAFNGRDAFILKLDSNGTFLWVKTYGGTSGTPEPLNIEFDALGNLYIMGHLDGTVDFDPGSGIFNMTESNLLNGYSDTYFQKLDTAGNFIWANKIDHGYINSFEVDLNGNVYSSGSTTYSLDINPGVGSFNVSPYPNNRDGFILKLDSAGNFVMGAKFIGAFGGANNCNVNTIDIDNNGNIYGTGSFGGQVDFDPKASIFNLSAIGQNSSQPDMFFLKLDALGNLIWVKQIGEILGSCSGTELVLDELGNFVIGGHFFSSIMDFDPSPSIYNLISTNSSMLFVVKYDTNGNLLWAKHPGGNTLNEDIYDPWYRDLNITLDTKKNIYIKSIITGTNDFDPGLGIFNLSASSSFTEYAIQKLDSLGNLVWVKQVKPTGNDFTIRSMSLDLNDNLLFTGDFYGAIDFDPSSNIYNLTNTSNFAKTDMYISKWNQDSCAYNIALIIDSVQNITCSSNFGFVSAYALGGFAPYSYSWNTIPATNDSFAVLDTSRIYEVTVNDANGCAKSSAVIINGPIDQNNFDLNANLIATSFRPGFSANLWLDVFNNGCLPASGQVKLILSYLVNYDSASIDPDMIQGDTLIWNFSSLIYDSIHFFPQVFLTTDTSATIGNQACFDVIVNPILGDLDSTNNIKNFCFDIINGYDPNDKKVYPKGECNEKYVLNNQKLTYTVRFQNTGNAEAINVYVIDSLDANLDINSVRITSKSHDKLITEVVEGNILKFRFDNIMLVDSATNEPESHGFVVFEVQPLPSLPNGTEINNNVNIYFDYNPAIATNSVLTTLIDNINFTTFGSITDTVCGGSYIAPSGYIYYSSGNYVDKILNSAGCDSLVSIDITIYNTTKNINVADCESFASPSGNYIWTKTGIYYDTIPSPFICDSIFIVNLTIYNKPEFKQLNKIVASDRSNGRFGNSVCIDGNYSIVGSYYNKLDLAGGNILNEAGSAYIFETDTSNNWIIKQKLIASDRAAYSQFGFSVSISANYAVVGAADAASAYIFERDINGVWMEKQKLIAYDALGGDFFGSSVSINGDYVIVGAKANNTDSVGNPMSNAGAAYIFKRDVGGSWNNIQKIYALDRASNDFFGYSVSISGNKIVVGSIYNDTDTNGVNYMNNAGSAYIYELNGNGNWIFIQKINAFDRADYDYFGSSVSINGNTIIIGAYDEDEDVLGGNYLSDAGSAYIYKCNINNVWTAHQKIVASNRLSGNSFGKYVSIKGDKLIVGTSGLISAYVFERNQSNFWLEKQKLIANDSSSLLAVSISDNYAVTGAVLDNRDVNGGNIISGAGSAYIFDYNYNSTINATTCNDYTLNSQTYTSSGTYQQLLTNQMGCDSVVTLNLTLNASGLLITQNGSTLFANDSTATYQWIDCSTGNSISGATNQTFIVTTNGDYAVVLSKNGCIDTSACISIMSVGTNDVVNDFGIEIYPNPTGKKLNVVFNKSEPYQLKIVAIDSKLIETKTIVGNTTFDVSNYSSGMYFITATNNEGKVYQSKFVKE